MKLTAKGIKAAKPADKAYKMFDGRELYLQITPAGSKTWRLKYRYGGKEKLITFGPYPEVRLADARDKATDARRDLINGVDPSDKKRREALELKYGQDTTFAKFAGRAGFDRDAALVALGRAEQLLGVSRLTRKC